MKERRRGGEEERESWIKEAAERVEADDRREERSRALAASAVSFREKNRSKPEDEKGDGGEERGKNQTVDLIRGKDLQCKTVVFLNGRRTERQRRFFFSFFLLLATTERRRGLAADRRLVGWRLVVTSPNRGS